LWRFGGRSVYALKQWFGVSTLTTEFQFRC
jgi:hypothetical protein